jgi:hypothetical protein
MTMGEYTVDVKPMMAADAAFDLSDILSTMGEQLSPARWYGRRQADAVPQSERTLSEGHVIALSNVQGLTTGVFDAETLLALSSVFSIRLPADAPRFLYVPLQNDATDIGTQWKHPVVVETPSDQVMQAARQMGCVTQLEAALDTIPRVYTTLRSVRTCIMEDPELEDCSGVRMLLSVYGPADTILEDEQSFRDIMYTKFGAPAFVNLMIGYEQAE